jgi:hypothetical protein
VNLPELKDTQSGRCFLIGNGPSLLRLTDVQREMLGTTFTSSRWFDWDRAWKPDFYVTTERKQATSFMAGGGYKKISAGLKFWVDWQPVPDESWVRVPHPPSNAHDVLNYGLACLWAGCQAGHDIGQHIAHGKDSPLAMAQLAKYMGFSELYLLGCETTNMGETYDEGRVRGMHAPGIMNAYYEKAKAWLVDCTPNGSLATERGGPLRYRELDEVLGLVAA